MMRKNGPANLFLLLGKLWMKILKKYLARSDLKKCTNNSKE
jgi:hypothetical protein